MTPANQLIGGKSYLSSHQTLHDLVHAFASGAHWTLVREDSTSTSELSSSPSMRLISQPDFLYYVQSQSTRPEFKNVLEMVVTEAMMQSLAESNPQAPPSPKVAISEDAEPLTIHTPKPHSRSHTPLPPTMKRPLSTTSLSSTTQSGVVSAPQTAKALTVFKMMNEREVQVVALLDDDGNLVGELGAMDLRWLADGRPPQLADLRLSAIEFADRANRGGVVGSAGVPAFVNAVSSGEASEGSESDSDKGLRYVTQFVTVGRQAALGDAVDKMVENEEWRAWVLEDEDERKPIGVVTISDVATMLLPEGEA